MESAFILKHDNPKKEANCISRLFFAWIVKLFYTGTQRSLKLPDLYKTLDSDKSEYLGNRLKEKWRQELLNGKIHNRKPSLLKAIANTFFWQYIRYGLVLFILQVILRSPQPVVLGWLISQFDNTTNPNRTDMYASASLLVGISTVIIFLAHHNNFGQLSMGMRVRIAVSSLVYKKILKLNKKSQGQTAAGQVVNLLSNDVQRFDTVSTYLNYLWILPFQLVLVTYFLWNRVGISCLTGILSIALLTLPVQAYLGKLASSLRLSVAQRTDVRVKLMSEIISGIQVIKMYAWEKPFEKLINILRVKELDVLTKSSYLRGFYLSGMIFTERTAVCLTVISYVLLGNHISAEIVFSMAQFFNILQFIMAIAYPMAVSIGAETLIAIKRLEDFLLLEEKEQSPLEEIIKPEIIIETVTASWTSTTVTLNTIDLHIPKGSLCAVIGPVGAGKSSLLQLLLGELPPSIGRIQIGGKISYSSQEPWLFAASVRKNIMFGKPYDPKLYKEVASVCALERDFEQLPYGDKTMVGERGVSLSGGQKARINLARAIYRQADVYLLDDPLSAVDTHVGKHLFDKCIVNYLKGKTRILVTHQLQYLKKADIIVVLNEGRIQAKGTFKELSNSDLDFTKLLATADETVDEKEKRDKEKSIEISYTSSRRLSAFNIGTESLLEQTVRDEEEVIETSAFTDGSPFMEYLKTVGNLCLIITVIIFLILSQASCTCTDLWLTFWTNQEELRYSKNSKIIESQAHFDQVKIEDTTYTMFKTSTMIYIYVGFVILVFILSISRMILFFNTVMKASKNIHKRMFHCLLQAPMRFFDTNPSGRILNRFSKDMGAIDELLPRVLIESIQIILVLIGILVTVIISNYFMIIAILLLGFVFLKVRQWYVSSAKDIKHLEGIAKSPVFSHVNSSLNGLTTIRALQAERILAAEFDDHQNVHTSAWFLTITCITSFGLWLDIICVIFIFCVTFGFVLLTDYGYTENSSLVGLAISQSLILTGMLQYGMRQSAEVVNQLTSVERVLQYTKLDKEGPFETPQDILLQNKWPSLGKIEFKFLNLIYIMGQAPVLKNLNFMINPGEKIGIVGRTGAGKSSIISALFRLAPLEGQILIDGIDTNFLGLSNLRKRISIIPQEPVLFGATLRYNLDPFNEFEDSKLWATLEEVELKDLVTNLDFQVSEGGSNFSLGQRQLICLARALLKNNKILVLDEATANVDARTDCLIQNTIRKKFKDCTVLTIAHRLNTIMDSDKVIVMGAGQLLEFDHPHKLLRISNGHFIKMVMETGKSMTDHLKKIALNSWKEKEEGESDDNESLID